MVKRRKPELERGAGLFQSLEADIVDAIENDQDIRSFALTRQFERCRKKFRVTDPRLHEVAVDKFLQANSAVKVDICADPAILECARDFIRAALENYTTAVRQHNVQVAFDRFILLDLWRFGPGASNGTRDKHPVEKFLNRATVTQPCLELFSFIARNHPFYHRDSNGGMMVPRFVEGSKLTTVPKNESTNRTIATEPSGNMLVQLALGRYLEGALRYIGLDIRRQAFQNNQLARLGSVNKKLATMDLSMASDMIGIALVRQLLPPEWVDALLCARSPVTSVGEDVVELRMISSMGNGFTFPLMTLILLSLLYGYARVHRGGKHRYVDFRQIGVFGDDIILPDDWYDDFAAVLESVGLIVNRDKSYHGSAPFRESCGGDYYDGFEVTPVYLKSLSCDADLYVCLNQVLEYSAKWQFHAGRTIEYLVSRLRGGVKLVPEWLGDTAGIRTALVSREYKHLRVKPDVRSFQSSECCTSLVAGGYVNPGKGGKLLYTARPIKTRYVTTNARLPNGYRDGACPLSRPPLVSHRISQTLIGMGLAGSVP